MPFEISPNMGIVAGIALTWVINSWLVYRYLARVPYSERDWADCTLPRRISWVVLGPVTWLVMGLILTFVLVLTIIDFVHEQLDQSAAMKWYRVRREIRRRRARIRREKFMSNSPA